MSSPLKVELLLRAKLTYGSFLITQVVSLNAFSCLSRSFEDYYVGFSGSESEPTTGRRMDMDNSNRDSCGVWPRCSYFNHACGSNACRSYIADVQFVRATRDIEAGTEVTFWYIVSFVTHRNTVPRQTLRPFLRAGTNLLSKISCFIDLSLNAH